jgi:pimeloyl-ACP methyl ester carboxylesterase
MRFAPVARMIDVRGAMRGLVYRDLRESSYDDSWVSDSVVWGYTAGLVQDMRATIRAYQGMARAEEPEMLRDHLGQIACPVVLLVGEKKHDSGPPSDEVELLLERLQSFVVDTIPRSGFFVHEEQPAAVVRVVSGMAR